MLSISIVLYKNKKSDIFNALNNLKPIRLIKCIFLIDNTENPFLSNSDFAQFPNVKYYGGHGNIGYGRGHNLAIFDKLNDSKYHVIMNLDLVFDNEILNTLFNTMEGDDSIVQLMPKVLNPDLTIQRVCKKLPTPINLITRRFFKKLDYSQKINTDYELKDYDYSYLLDSPYLSGCFMFCRLKALKFVRGFDERFFMYPEDIDLTRRMHLVGRTICYPHVHVIHEHGKASYSSKKMALIHSANMIKYFNKWGWFYDKERVVFNKRLDMSIKYLSLENNKFFS